MNVIPPETITDATLDTSNVVENDFAEYVNATSYDLGDVVMVSTVEPDIHRNFESLKGGNQGNDPWLDDGTNWLDLGATNRWAMFDTVNGTQTTNSSTIEVEITQGIVINAVALLNVVGKTVQVIVDDPVAGEVYNRTIVLQSTVGINNWHAYYFTPITPTTDAVFLDLPSFINATIKIIVAEPGGTAAIGVAVIGVINNIGTTTYGTGIGIIDYSVKDTDAFGNFIIIKRNFSKRADYDITIDTNRVSDVQNFLASLTTVPVVWVGHPDFGSTFVYGYYRDFDIVLSSFLISECNIVVEGLT